MKVKELKENMVVPEMELTITELGEKRTVGNNIGLLEGKAKDEDGDEVIVVFWREDVEGKEVGQKLKVTDGWVKSYNGQLQLSAGKQGSWVVV